MISARDAFLDTEAFSRERARPLAPDERRAAILDAVIPLIQERGRDVSTRQMAEAAGVAEGTLFRAFGDKDSIIEAATERHLDPEPLRTALRGLDPDEATEVKVRQTLELLRTRFEGIIGFSAALGMSGPPPRRPSEGEDDWLAIMRQLFRADELAVPVDTLSYYLRLLAFATAIPIFNQLHPFSTDEIAGLVLRGALPTPIEGES